MGVEGNDIYNSGCHNYCFFGWMRLHKETCGKDWTWNHSCFGLNAYGSDASFNTSFVNAIYANAALPFGS